MAKVQFKRYETDAEVQASDIVDGQFIVTKEGTSYIDYGEDRVATNGTPDITMSDSSQNAVQNKVVKEYVDDVDDKIGTLNNLTTTANTNIVNAINGITGTILWTNSSPTSNFAAQTVNLSSSDYDLLELIWVNATNEPYIQSTKVLKGKGVRLFDGFATSASKIGYRSRNMTYTNDTQYAFSSGGIYTIGSGAYTESNAHCIPLYIIGYKTGLFS